MSDDDRTLSLNDQQFAIMEGRHLADMFLRTTRGVTRAKALSLAEAFRLCDQQRADAMSETFALRAQLATVMAERDEARLDAKRWSDIAAKVNEALNRAGCYSALYFWEHIDGLAANRDAALARAERAERERDELPEQISEWMQSFVMQRPSMTLESYRTIAEWTDDIRAGLWRTTKGPSR